MKTVIFGFLSLFIAQYVEASVDQILSMQQQDGNYHVICTNLRQELTTVMKIKLDQVCVVPQVPGIDKGLYQDASGHYCEQYVTPGDKTLRVEYKGSCSGNSAQLKCEAGSCEGFFNGQNSSYYQVKLVIRDNKTYDYYGVGNASPKTFSFTSSVAPFSLPNAVPTDSDKQ